ncbi:GNAT family N-acetyltransferase [Actinoplanes sp. KI2]|uniref:GNAT family N-acetyltransferase n=1 Tax=Actinoplanes sp. KI2 TaxID=2983315 RepID=UPI0021D5FCBE|nr:GNAT family N-acetyltransferase [Actinoplanes sp. KI2]MCU7724804.1 GNAT family N-acetyltransferase [Actinoplanes sp. KI2]
MVIRERRDADLPGCVSGLRAVHEADGYPLNWPPDPAGWLSPPGLARAWVAELPGIEPAGHLAVQTVSDTSAEVSRLFVVPTARRRGVAEALMTRAVEWARERRLGLSLEVAGDRRSPAVAFYESHGWRYTHTSVADWTGPGGRPVELRHYRPAE